jgi:putative hydrolase of the HAD superfamily
MKKIKAVIFDLGGVIVNYNNLYAAKRISRMLDISIFKLLKVALGERSKLIKEYQKGMPARVFWKKVSKKLGIKDFEQKKVEKAWCEMFSLNKPVFQLLPKLKRHYKLALLSNTIKVHGDYVFKKYHLRRFFSVITFSYKVKTRKPEAKIFKITLKKLNTKPSETLFIDDLHEFVSVARKLNINSIRFRNIKKLKQDLRKFGIGV